MFKGILLLALVCTLGFVANGQSELPYAQIPDYPEEYTAETVAARMIDGLGFRYYWASEGLRPEDLAYKPSDEARTCGETLDDIYGLTNVVVNAVRQKPNVRRSGDDEMSFEEKRAATLMNIKEAADMLRAGKVSLEDCIIVFQRDSGNSEYPFWNNINGPIADALWHCGQVVSLRRASGNPFNSNVSLLRGSVRD